MDGTAIYSDVEDLRVSVLCVWEHEESASAMSSEMLVSHPSKDTE